MDGYFTRKYKKKYKNTITEGILQQHIWNGEDEEKWRKSLVDVESSKIQERIRNGLPAVDAETIPWDDHYFLLNRDTISSNYSRAELRDFEAICPCPNCGTIACHWLSPILRLTRGRENGELTSKTAELISRECQKCGNSWAQKR